MGKTARCVTTAVRKLVSPEDDEDAAFDRSDDLVRSAGGLSRWLVGDVHWCVPNV